MNTTPGNQTTSDAPDVTPTIKPPPSVPSISTPSVPNPVPNVPLTPTPASNASASAAAGSPPPAVPTNTPPPPPAPPVIPPGGTGDKPFADAQDKPPSTVSATPLHKKFPFMMVTFFITVVLAGLSGSFLFFQYTSAKNPSITPAQILITPSVTIAPTATTAPANPFDGASENLTTNPFASPTAVVNPFGTYENPFSGATISATPNPVTNPFE